MDHTETLLPESDPQTRVESRVASIAAEIDRLQDDLHQPWTSRHVRASRDDIRSAANDLIDLIMEIDSYGRT